MKLFLTIIPLSISSLLLGQNNFASQLNQIIKDSANHFKKFRGDFKELVDHDSIFYTTTTLEGTRENDILVTQRMSLYRCEIVDSVNERRGKTIVDEWHQKLIGFLGPRFNSEKTKIKSSSPVKYGWNFKKGDTWIDISLLPVGLHSSKYYVSLAVTYISPDFYKLK